MCAKYAVDAAAFRIFAGIDWTPLDYLCPTIAGGKGAKLTLAPVGLLWGLALWTLPFLWIGAAMTLRRITDAGSSPVLATLFFVPIVNYVLMLTLCFLPSKAPRPGTTARAGTPPRHVLKLRSGLAGTVSGLAAALLIVPVIVYVLREYGAALFLATPFLIGAVSGFVFNYRKPESIGMTCGIAVQTILLTAGALLLFAFEGFVCIAMAAPIAMVIAVPGAIFGRAIAIRMGSPLQGAAMAVLFVPSIAGVESLGSASPLYEVVSSIEVAAPPATVWRHVVSFSELPPPKGALFATGLAYPVRARIEGHGVGAVRHCEFSTGSFVEPITRWEEPTRLSFDVVAQPPPMEEWSFWSKVHPPHLDGYFRSRRGEFRLVELPGGRTRLEGSTWYELDVRPRLYWCLFADPFVAAIHRRVLEHVKSLSEKD